jgi:hypothetical protein
MSLSGYMRLELGIENYKRYQYDGRIQHTHKKKKTKKRVKKELIIEP